MEQKTITLPVMSETTAEIKRSVKELAGAYGPKVFHAAYRIVGNEAVAQDIQQDVFVRLLKRMPEGVESWPALLTTMATRAAIDHLRSQRRRARLLNLLGSRDGPRSPEDLGQASEMAAALRAALGSLSHRESQAFCLRYLSDFSNAQVARALEITENNVGVVLNRARAKLAKRLSLHSKENHQ